jgi:hypothetical protein
MTSTSVHRDQKRWSTTQNSRSNRFRAGRGCFAFEYGDLLSQGEDFESQIAATSKERPEREDQRKDGFHRHETYTFNMP